MMVRPQAVILKACPLRPLMQPVQAMEKIVQTIYNLGEGVTQAQLRRHLGINSVDVSKRVNKAIDQGLVGQPAKCVRFSSRRRNDESLLVEFY
jgi:hypothetical protein